MVIDVGDFRKAFLRRIFCNSGVIIFAVVLSLNEIIAFNLDSDNPAVYHNPTKNKSYFGFTVAQYINDGNQPKILVGAPISEDETVSSNYTGGALYVCDVNDPVECSKINFPQSKTNLEYNQNQWLGATLATAGSRGGIVVTCAPRYCNLKDIDDESGPIGSCYFTEKGFLNFTSQRKYNPYELIRFGGHLKVGSGQAGFSAAVSEDSKTLYVGAVGAYNWGGQVLAKNIRNSNESKSSGDGKKESYLGYSMTSLNFRGNVSGVAVGQPRGHGDLNESYNNLGQVILYKSSTDEGLPMIKIITGEQFGAYFGYSICASDVDGDGAEDLIIGAPLHYENSLFETGRIYVHYQGNLKCPQLNQACGKKIFNEFVSIAGTKPGARFGHAVTSLGDINHDGFADIAVSAPYETDVNNQSGAVYVYLGSKNGLSQYPSQIIRASDIVPDGKNTLKSFGFSLFGGLDLDGNKHPDLAVGAYESEVVFLFKSRPVIHLRVNFSYSLESKNRGKIIDLNTPNCKDERNENALCVGLRICLQYDGQNVEKKIEISANITLDTKQSQSSSSRMHFFSSNGPHKYKENFPLEINIENCKTLKVFVEHSNPKMDRLTSLDAKLEYDLVRSKKKKKLPDILNFGPRILTDSLEILTNCGNDKICVPDLNLTIVPNFTEIVITSNVDLVQLDVSVQNDGEDSFDSKFALNISHGLDFYNSHTHQSVFCDQVLNNTRNIICKIGNPLRAKQRVNFIIYLRPGPDLKSKDTISLWASVNSTNLENKSTMKNNQRSFKIPVIEEIRLNIRSDAPFLSAFNIFKFSFGNDTDVHAGPMVKHRYYIENLNPSIINEITAVFYWPFKLSTGEDLLYLVQQPKTYGKIKCDVDSKYINHRNLMVTRDYEKNENSGASEESRSVSNFTPPINKNLQKRSVGLDTNSKGSNNTICINGACFLHVSCKIYNLSKDEETSVMFPSLLWAETIQRIARGKTKPVIITSHGELNIAKLVNNRTRSTNMTFLDEVSTKIEIPKNIQPDVIPLWMVVVSASLGVLILLIMVYGLYKCRFFERNRPPSVMSGTYARSMDDFINDIE